MNKTGVSDFPDDFSISHVFKGLKNRTRGMLTPSGKPRVFFCCHPTDFNRCFLPITEDILQLHRNCAVWYLDEQQQLEQEELEDFFFELRHMQLIVFPVTDNFLGEDNFVRNHILPFAQEKHIPLLPVLQDENLGGEFNKLCGCIQCMIRQSNNMDSRNYEKKLSHFLNAVLSNDTLADVIHKIWDLSIFLSYRKKDRKYARELMELIHKSKYCRRAAIWYDEYLTPGEEFNQEIEEKINSCDLFIMIITPNLLESNNYVQQIEYPVAKKKGIYLVPVEMVPADREMLYSEYDELPSVISTRNKVRFLKELDEKVLDMRLRKIGMTLESYRKLQAETDIQRKTLFSGTPAKNLSHEARRDFFDNMNKLCRIGHKISNNQTNTRHKTYLLGLAYLNGIDVEVDTEKAVHLIRTAANKGELQASKKLVEMYLYGNGVEQDYEKAEEIQKKTVYYWEKRIQKCCKESNILSWIDEMMELGELYTEIHKNDEAETVWLNLSYALEQYRNYLSEDIWLQKSLSLEIKMAFCSLKENSFREHEIQHPLELYNQMVKGHKRLKKSQYSEIWLLYAEVGEILQSKDKHKAEQYYLQGIHLFEQAIADSQFRDANKKSNLQISSFTKFLLRYHSLLCICLAELYKKQNRRSQQRYYLEKGIQNYETAGLEVIETWKYEQLEIYKACMSLSDFYLQDEDSKKACKYLTAGISIGEMFTANSNDYGDIINLIFDYLNYAELMQQEDEMEQVIHELLTRKFAPDFELIQNLVEIFDHRLDEIRESHEKNIKSTRMDSEIKEDASISDDHSYDSNVVSTISHMNISSNIHDDTCSTISSEQKKNFCSQHGRTNGFSFISGFGITGILRKLKEGIDDEGTYPLISRSDTGFDFFQNDPFLLTIEETPEEKLEKNKIEFFKFASRYPVSFQLPHFSLEQDIIIWMKKHKPLEEKDSSCKKRARSPSGASGRSFRLTKVNS